jgi:hypothetical protein
MPPKRRKGYVALQGLRNCRVGETHRPHGKDCVILGWVKPTGLTAFAVGFTHPTNGSPVRSRDIVRSLLGARLTSLSVIVGWVKATGLTAFAVGFTHPTNGSRDIVRSLLGARLTWL